MEESRTERSHLLTNLLSPNEIELYPKLSLLLTTLGRNIDDYVSKTLQDDLIQAKAEMKREEKAYLQNSTIFVDFKELLMDMTLQCDDKNSNKDEYQLVESVQELIAAIECEKIVHCDLEGQMTLLGIGSQHLSQTVNQTLKSPGFHQKLIPLLEENLQRKCERIVSCYNTSKMGKGKLPAECSSQLPPLLESEMRHLVSSKDQVEEGIRKQNKLFNQYYQILLQSLDTMETLLTRHQLTGKAEFDNVNHEWLTARCEALCLKVRVLELEILCDTYPLETVPALTEIRNQLDGEIKQHEKSLVQSSQALNAYQSIGAEFEQLVNDYRRVMREIEERSWALQELQKNTDS